uniref:Uncharacterized protein n=1 Tax=Hucho hucho TaxID=62062 RepID=A0A4W5N4E2_9TELE
SCTSPPAGTVAVLWGCNNPYMKRGTEGIEHVKKENKFLQFLAEVKFLFLNIKVNSHLYLERD